MPDPRRLFLSRLSDLVAADETTRPDVAEGLFAPEMVAHISAPVNMLSGRDAVIAEFYAPLSEALSGMRRRDLLFLGGANRRAEGGTWMAALTHYVGRFQSPLWGIAPNDRLVFLRAGEFYRVADGRIDRMHVIVDLIDLLRQIGRSPLPHDMGAEMTFPAPATQDGLCPASAGGEESLDIVERMLGALTAYDPTTFASEGQAGAGGTWADDLMWYGPGGIGSTSRWDGFVDDHRAPFLRAFPDRIGGNHYCRIGDGPYAAVSGWPSMTMTHRGPYLGVAPTGRALTLRVMDFYRLSAGRIAENWVLLDYVDLLAQMGVDVLGQDRG